MSAEALPAEAARPLSLVSVPFAELYDRHLYRHSQAGINVAHLLALVGVWFGVYGLAYWLVPSPWVPVGLAIAYLLAIAPNLPARVTAAVAVFLVAFVALVVYVPPLPWWAYLLMVPVFYKFQAYNHKIWTAARDMTRVDQRFPKGQPLFWVLLFYEIPFLLNYLLFDRTRRPAGG
jgi:hypothetical protein